MILEANVKPDNSQVIDTKLETNPKATHRKNGQRVEMTDGPEHWTSQGK